MYNYNKSKIIMKQAMYNQLNKMKNFVANKIYLKKCSLT